MMNRFDRRIVLAVLLILAGVLFLMQNLGIIRDITGLVWAGLFALGGLAFLAVLINDRRAWWAAIPGIILLDLGALIAASEIFPAFANSLGGPFFLAGMGLAFWVVYFLAPQNWWAIIPGGVLLTLSAVAGFDVIPGLETGGIFFMGLGVTFGLLGLISPEGRRMSWPWIPAGILFVMGILIFFSQGNLINVVWPLVLIAAGGFLLFRGYFRRNTL
jgi:hypothetical protein